MSANPANAVVFDLLAQKSSSSDQTIAGFVQQLADMKTRIEALKPKLDVDVSRAQEKVRQVEQQIARMTSGWSGGGRWTPDTDIRQNQVSNRTNFEQYARDQQAAAIRVRREVERTVTPMQALAAAAADADKKMAAQVASAKGIGDGLDKSVEGAIRLGKALAIARFAAEGLRVAADIKDLATAGTSEESAAAKAALRQTLVGLPVAGGIAEQISRLGSTDVEHAGPDWMYFGHISNAEERDMDRLEAENKGGNPGMIAMREKFSAIDASAKAYAEAQKQQNAMEGMTPGQRAVARAKNELADVEKKFADSDSAGPAIEAARGGVTAAERALAKEVGRERGKMIARKMEEFGEAVAGGTKAMLGRLGDAIGGTFSGGNFGEEQERRRLTLQDADFEARQLELRNSGQGGRAAVEAIRFRAKRDIEAAGDNPELQKQIRRRESAELQGLLQAASVGAGARGTIEGGANRTSFGAAGDRKDEAADVLRAIIKPLLEKLNVNITKGVTAVTS